MPVGDGKIAHNPPPKNKQSSLHQDLIEGGGGGGGGGIKMYTCQALSLHVVMSSEKVLL